MTTPADTARIPDPALIESLFRIEGGRARAAVAAMTQSLDLAEEAVQEAFADALRAWPRSGVPDRPGAWITTAAKNRAIDKLRREAQRPERERQSEVVAVSHVASHGPSGGADEELQLLFTCCHPALSETARIALSLRFVFGLTAREIARLFLEPEPTVAQRLTRAKAKIRTARIPLRVPPPELFGERVPTVLSCLYLTFTEGYAPVAGDDAIRGDLCTEAIRLTQLVHGLVPEAGEVQSLLALFLFQHSRRDARLAFACDGADGIETRGGAVPLEEQDRCLWDRQMIDAGLTHLSAAAKHDRDTRGPYFYQAVIAGAHAVAPTFAATAWTTIVAAYDRLAGLHDSPVIHLNRAIALGFRDGPDAGLRELATLRDDKRLARLPSFAVAQADLLRRAARYPEAVRAYEEALSSVSNEAVCVLLRRRLREVQSAAQLLS